ncbi:MAG: hypothetical protein ABW252_02710 [Polyangiales bacterium]
MTDSEHEESTRILCASVVLGHAGARERVLQWARDHGTAVAPEIGLDMRLILQLAHWAERRSFLCWLSYLVLASVALLLLAAGWTSLAITFAGITGATLWMSLHIRERNQLAPFFTAARFDKDEVAKNFPAKVPAPETARIPRRDQNLVVYGAFTPFIGAGVDLGGWSVAIAIDKPKENLLGTPQVQPFTTSELYAEMDGYVNALRLDRMAQHDVYFTSGATIRDDRALLPNVYGEPTQRLNDLSAERLRLRGDRKVRHYRCYRVLDWGGDLALSYYIRCALRGNTLFVETKRFILPPMATKYRSIDDVVHVRFKEWAATTTKALFLGPICVAAAPIFIAAQVGDKVHGWLRTKEKERREEIDRCPQYNFGAKHCLRQDMASEHYHHYFQLIDGDFYNKVLQREILDGLVDFLDQHGIDTTDLRDRQTTILNSGLIVQGGDVRADAISVGPGARATKHAASSMLHRRAAGEAAQ